MEEKNLVFVLTYKWFDLINAGLKGVEYREIKKSVVEKIFDVKEAINLRKFKSIEELIDYLKNINPKYIGEPMINYKHFDNILLYRAYEHNRAEFKAPIKSITIEYPEKHLCLPEAEKTLHFAIRFYDYSPIEECCNCGKPILLGGHYSCNDNKYCSSKCLHEEYSEEEYEINSEISPENFYYTEY